MRISILFLLFLCVPGEAFATPEPDYESIVRQAFAANERSSADDWAVTRTHTAEGVTRVSRFDPRRAPGGQWSLISVDGVPATAEQIDEYRQDAAESDAADTEDESFGSDYVTPGSLRLLEESETKYRFSFLPSYDEDSEDAELMQDVSGVLSIDKNAHYVEFIELVSSKSFKPERGVKISTFRMLMRFSLHPTNGQVLLEMMRVHVKGRAFLIFDFDEVEETVYSDYLGVSEHSE